MNPEVRAILRWVPASRGGREILPVPAAGYSAPVRFEADPEAKHGNWSLLITHARSLRGDEVIEAKVSFLVEEAPHAVLLREGERFEFMEGVKAVAKGVILPSAVAIPEIITEFDIALLG